MFCIIEATTLFILLTVFVTFTSANTGTIPLPKPPNTGKRYPGCLNKASCAAQGGATCFPPAGTNPCLYSKDTPSVCGKLVRCATHDATHDPRSAPDCGNLIARQGTKVCPSADSPDSSWFGCFSSMIET